MWEKTWVSSQKLAQSDGFTKDILKEKFQKFINSPERYSQKDQNESILL